SPLLGYPFACQDEEWQTSGAAEGERGWGTRSSGSRESQRCAPVPAHAPRGTEAPDVGQVALRGVSKHFGAVEAVRDFDLEVEDQEFLVLLGPSGCGKPKDRDIAMVFQNYALYPHMTVGRNIDFPLKCRGMPKPERAGLVASAAEALGLPTLLDRRPAKLSGGPRQRVALAR